MGTEKANPFILIQFVDGHAEFDIRTDMDEQILTALLGLEGYFAQRTGLATIDIREVMDEMKNNVQVKAKRMDGVEDWEVVKTDGYGTDES